MDEVRGKSFRNEVVKLDGNLFINCSFENCVLQFSGDHCEWEHSHFANYRIVLDGKANNTIQVLRGLGFNIRGLESDPPTGAVH